MEIHLNSGSLNNKPFTPHDAVMKQSFIFLADGFETIEATTPADVLRRAGMAVKTVSITSSRTVTSVQGVTIGADVIFDPTLFTEADWLILPGGMPGAENLHKFAPLAGLLRAHLERGGRVAAICAAPAVVLGQEGMLKGYRATCYPGFEGELKGATYVDAPVVADAPFVLGNGPANALVWSLAIVREALGQEVADKIGSDMLYFRNDKRTENFFG